jgi:hypothetical protein
MNIDKTETRISTSRDTSGYKCYRVQWRYIKPWYSAKAWTTVLVTLIKSNALTKQEELKERLAE